MARVLPGIKLSPNLRLFRFLNPVLLNQKVLQHQAVHFTLRQSAEGVGGGTDNGLALQVKRRVQHDGHTRSLTEPFNQAVVKGTLFTENSLQTPGSISVYHRY